VQGSGNESPAEDAGLRNGRKESWLVADQVSAGLHDVEVLCDRVKAPAVGLTRDGDERRVCSRCDKKFAQPLLTKTTFALSRFSSGGLESGPPMTSPIRIAGCNAFRPMLCIRSVHEP
jgi:hypothetical protein